MSDNKKICFISCVNNDVFYGECLKYIQNLIVPDGYTIDTISIKDAKSMCEGYNAAMGSSDAKYKVYLHQDTFIINKNFISDILELFNNNEKIGMLGICGAETIPTSAIWWNSTHKYGKVYENHTGEMKILDFNEVNENYHNVKILDGLIMVTQYDLPWREDIFNGWHFYDISQCTEFILAGYEVVVPNQNVPWCMHDCGVVETKNGFDEYRKLFIKEYMSNLKIKFLNFGINSKVEDGFEVFCPQGISVGNNVVICKDACFMLPYNNFKDKPLIIIEDGCSLGRRIMISAVNKIHIGKRCIFASNVHITDHNHEYHNVGIPIMGQGIDSFNNEVNIGEGSWIANNCVIVGNVNIGKGCTIGANSLVNSDIPDYCVVVGSPARVVKAFDYASGEWIKIKNNNELSKVLEDRRKSQPILSICIPTYNRATYLDKCLKSIFDQIGDDRNIEVVVSDNNSEDNTKEIVDSYMSKFKNLKYFKNKTNIGPDRNVLSALKKGNGKFITAHGDDDYFAPYAIYKLINKLYANSECGLFYIFNSSNINEKIGCDINEFIGDVSFYSTFISGIVLRKSDFYNVKENDKFISYCLNQVYLELLILLDNKSYCVLYDNFFSSSSGEHKPFGYNFGEVFIENYLKILYYFKKFGLEDETIRKEKEKLIKGMILPWCKIIKSGGAKLEISDIEKYIEKYYSNETYFEEVLVDVNNILK